MVTVLKALPLVYRARAAFRSEKVNLQHKWRVRSVGSLDFGNRYFSAVSSVAPRKHTEDTLTYSVSHLKTYAANAQICLGYLRRHAPEFEFILMPYNTPVTVIFRPTENAESKWTTLSVRFPHEYKGTTTFYRLRSGKQSTSSEPVFGFDCLRHHLYCFPGVGFFSSVQVQNGNRFQQQEHRIDGNGVASVLMKCWACQLQLSAENWLLQPIFKGKEKVWAKSVFEAWSRLYIPLRISVRFSLISARANVCLDDIPVLHRKVVRRRQSDASLFQYRSNIYKGLHGDMVPFDVNDDITFFIFVVLPVDSDPTCGVFLIPKSALHREGYLSDPEKGVAGRRRITVYPPLLHTPHEETQRKQEWQNSFYLDLSNETAVEQSRLKFVKIFSENRN